MIFKRYEHNPIIPRKPGTFHSIHAANPDFIMFKDKYFFYFRGQAEEGHDQMGIGFTTKDKFDGINWEFYKENPVIRVGKNKNDFDSNHILDPAAAKIDNKIFLYYSAHPIDRVNQNFSVGLAVSEDGFHFEKVKENPVIYGAICPEVILHNKKIYLFYQRLQKDGYFKIYFSKSNDGLHFSEETEVFGPSGKEGVFDKFSISTVRIWSENGLFFMAYGGCPKYYDYPSAIGLARSKDLIKWERYPDNPVFSRGNPGEWDEAAMWFATIHKFDKTYYMWYEGVGTGNKLTTPQDIEFSKKARDEDYGGYRETSFSQIGLACFNGDSLNW